MGKILIKLADVPNFAREEYHPDQVRIYAEFTKLTFQALNLPSIRQFMEQLADSLNLRSVEVRVMRLPSWKSKTIRFAGQQLRGRVGIKSQLIDIFPDIFWSNKLSKPFGVPSPRGFILNSTLRALIHEMLHISGLKDEDEVRS